MSFFKNKILKDSINTTLLSVIGKGIGFLIPILIANWFGVSSKTDAFFFTYGIVIFIAGIFAPVVESVIVPYITESKMKNENIDKFINSVLNLSVIILLLLIICFVLLIKPVLQLISKFNIETINLILKFSLEISPIIILLVLSGIISGLLNAYKKFVYPPISVIYKTIFTLIIIYILKDTYGINSVVIAYLVGEVFRILYLFYVSYKNLKLKLKFYIDINPKLKDFFLKGSYQVIGMIAVGLNPIIDRIMASWLGSGSVSYLYYAERLYMIPIIFLTTGLMVVILSHWSENFYKINNTHIINKNIKQLLKILFLPLLALTILLIMSSKFILTLIFSHGHFTQENIYLLRNVWICYLIGVPGYVIGMIYVRAYLVLKYTNLLMKIAFVTILLNVLLNYIFMLPFGIKGIALSTSVSIYITTFCQILLFKRLNKRI